MAESIQFSSFNEYFSDFHPHSMFYSWNGCGKTTLAGRTGLRTVLLDCGDAGVVTLRGSQSQRLRIIKIKNCYHYLDVMEFLCRKANSIDLLVVDTLTGLQSRAIREVKGKKGEMNQKKWGQVGSRVIECISETRNFPKDVIYLAQEKRKSRDEGEGVVQIIGPSITPSVREFLSSCVDWVGRLYVEDDRRKLSFRLTDTIEAKDRATLFPKPLVLPELSGDTYPVYSSIRKRIIENIHADKGEE